VSRAWQVAKRSVVSFYDDQGRHHAAALTYYALMSLFPTLLLAVSLLGLLGEFIYYVTPDVRQRAFRLITPGALTGVAMWLAVSAAFSTYLANFGSFNVTYGSFAAAIILLVWLWLTNVALLFGAEIKAQIEPTKEISDTVPEPETLNLSTGR
jgi:membrane protein